MNAIRPLRWTVAFLLLLGGPLQSGTWQPAASASASEPEIRVRLWAETYLPRVRISAESPMELNGAVLPGPLTVFAQAPQLVIVDGVGQAHLLLRLTLSSQDFLTLEGPQGIPLKTRGTLEISLQGQGLLLVNQLSLEAYVLGIVGPELGDQVTPPESLKAQLIASRSYALAMRGRHQGRGYDFCDSPHCQVFTGFSGVTQEQELAAFAVRGEYLSYQGQPIPAFFHDTCGGYTTAASDVWKIPPVPYLVRVRDGSPDSYCRFAARAHWHFQLDRQQLKACLRARHWVKKQEALDTVKVMRYDRSGRATQVLVQTDKPLWVSARKFTQAINRHYGSQVIPSTVFKITRDKNRFHFFGRGWGHGVGLCQCGAIQMAKEGKSYREILAHYYPHTQLGRMDDIRLAKLNNPQHLN